ncbi:MAG: 6-bladed beta-propeller [Tannerellaceae bacterium]|jgi:hypothetical protein|nr:6-bladed beta-propeller [Tannerellaceae bacterium]
MKRALILSATVMFILSGCRENKQSNDELITVDVTKSYPKKELILQDFMDVEYVPLEATDEFITMGWLHAVGKDIIVVRNRNRNSDGDIFIFDRNGKGLKKINRQGPGAEEYQFLLGITLDEENGELLVNDRNTQKIFVYDMNGNYKRNFSQQEGYMYDLGMYNFDREHLICRNFSMFGSRNDFFLVSKLDGSIAREVEIPYKEKISTAVWAPDSTAVMPVRNRTLVPHANGWMLMEASSDTVYSYSTGHSLTPLIVRTPSIRSMTTGVFLYPALLTDRYCFMQTVEAKWDWETDTGHTRIDFMYDRQENVPYEYVVYNGDYTNKQPVSMTSEVTFGNNEIGLVQTLQAFDLVEAYEKGQLKDGKLKEIAATLDEEDNPVIMLMKYKK